VHPKAEQESIFRTFFAGWGDLDGGSGLFSSFSLCIVLTATTKKGRQLFFRKKCTPRENPGYAYEF